MKLYAVRNKEGKYFRAKGFNSYGKSWVDKIEDARIYTNPSAAKNQITYWGKNHPEFGVPDLVVLDAKVEEVVDQVERVSKAINTRKRREMNREIKKIEKRKKLLNEELVKLNEMNMQLLE